MTAFDAVQVLDSNSADIIYLFIYSFMNAFFRMFAQFILPGRGSDILRREERLEVK
jgi:hypothetical protein